MAESCCPGCAVPLIVGAAVFDGGAAVTVVVGAEVADADPSEFIAVTCTAIVWPTSEPATV